SGDTLNVTGTFTNAAGSTLYLYQNSGDVANVNALSNAGTVYIGTGTTLNLENGQSLTDTPNGGTLTVASTGTLTLSTSGTTLSVTGTLSDAGTVTIGSGTTLNLSQSMSDLPKGGSLIAEGTTNALAGLTSVEGHVYLVNGQTSSVTPGGSP